MKRYWQEKNPALYVQMQAQISAKYPTLHFRVSDQIVFLNGTLQITDAQGVFTYFLVEIELLPEFPEALPIVREVAGRIPRIADRHMLPGGTACLHVQEDWYYAHPDGYTLLEFLDGPVLSFFVGQTCVEHGKPWPYGERAHGVQGILECYSDLTGAKDFATISRFMRALTQKELKGHHSCPCGSRKKLRNCHKNLLEVRSRIPLSVIQRRWLIIATMDKQGKF